MTQVDGVDLAALKRKIGRIGVWTGSLRRDPAVFARNMAAEVEDLGFGALWVGEVPTGKEALVDSAILLGATHRLVVATGIASIWGRDATAAANAARALTEAYDGRFLLGLGVSHAPAVAMRGHDYRRPLAAMRAYLDAMDATQYAAPLPEPAPRVLAALRRGMLELARDRAQGAHPYFTTPEHTARARATVGPDPVLAPEQALVLETDPVRARQIARDYMSPYLALPNYVNNLRDLGWDDRDLADGGSDALVDAIVPWGDTATVAERVRAHLQVGADHVCIQPVTDTTQEQLAQLRLLAPALIEA